MKYTAAYLMASCVPQAYSVDQFFEPKEVDLTQLAIQLEDDVADPMVSKIDQVGMDLINLADGDNVNPPQLTPANELKKCPCSSDQSTFCDDSEGTGQGKCQKCDEFKDRAQCLLAGFNSSGAQICQRVCFDDAKKKFKRVYTPFKLSRGKCTGVDQADMIVKWKQDKDITFKDCRHKCEFLGEHCGAMTWGPNEDRLQEWLDYKDLIDKGKQPDEPSVPFEGYCELFEKKDQCDTFKGDKDTNFECHIRMLNIPTYKIQSFSYQNGQCQGGIQEDMGKQVGEPIGLGTHGDGCRRKCQEDKTCDAYEFTQSSSQCTFFRGKGIKGEGQSAIWKQVRFIPRQFKGWDRYNDRLTGTEIFGDPSKETKAWGIPFDNLDFKEVKITSQDGTTFKQQMIKKEVYGKINQYSFFEDAEFKTISQGIKVLKNQMTAYNLGAKVYILTSDKSCTVKLNNNFMSPSTQQYPLATGKKPIHACDQAGVDQKGLVLQKQVAMKKSVGLAAEQAHNKGITKMEEDTDFVWTLFNCKNTCNQNRQCSAFSFDGDLCRLVVPKPPKEVQKIDFNGIFDKSREGICSNDYKGPQNGEEAEYEVDGTLQDCMQKCNENIECKKILFSTFTYGVNLSKHYCEIWTKNTSKNNALSANTGALTCYMKREKMITLFNESQGECRNNDAQKNYDVTLLNEREDLNTLQQCKDECNSQSDENCAAYSFSSISKCKIYKKNEEVGYHGNGDFGLSCYVRVSFKETDPAQFFVKSAGQCMQAEDKEAKPATEPTKKLGMTQKQCLQGCKDDASCLTVSYIVKFHPAMPAMEAIAGVPGKPAVPASEGVAAVDAVPEIKGSPAQPATAAYTEKACSQFTDGALKGDDSMQSGDCYSRRANVPGKTAAPEAEYTAEIATTNLVNLVQDYDQEDFEIEEENLVTLLENNNWNSDGMCFIKNRERGSNEFSDCTEREFKHTQSKISVGGKYNIPGAIFAYIFVAFALAATCVVCTITLQTDEDDDVNFGRGGYDDYEGGARQEA